MTIGEINVKNYVCNPINMEYKYQIFDTNGETACREAADPSLILFKGKYYLFPSMTTGFLASDNLIDWQFHPLKNMPVYDYAPDVRVIGDYLYFSASKRNENCSFFRTKDPINEEFEEIHLKEDLASGQQVLIKTASYFVIKDMVIGQ